MSTPVRVTPNYAWEKMRAAAEILLVCAYEEDEKYRKYDLEGSISFKELEKALPSIPKDAEIVFYCA